MGFGSSFPTRLRPSSLPRRAPGSKVSPCLRRRTRETASGRRQETGQGSLTLDLRCPLTVCTQNLQIKCERRRLSFDVVDEHQIPEQGILGGLSACLIRNAPGLSACLIRNVPAPPLPA